MLQFKFISIGDFEYTIWYHTYGGWRFEIYDKRTGYKYGNVVLYE
jgi:hypothetical protein